MLFYCYANVAIRPFQRLFMALFVRKFTFATRFCDVSIVCFCIFYLNAVFLRFQALLFLPLAIPALHPLFCSTIRNKKQLRRFFRTHPRCSSVRFRILFLCLTEPDITQSATKPAKKDMAQRIAEPSKKAGPLAKPCLLLFCPPPFMRHLSI